MHALLSPWKSNVWRSLPFFLDAMVMGEQDLTGLSTTGPLRNAIATSLHRPSFTFCCQCTGTGQVWWMAKGLALGSTNSWHGGAFSMIGRADVVVLDDLLQLPWSCNGLSPGWLEHFRPGGAVTVPAIIVLVDRSGALGHLACRRTLGGSRYLDREFI